LRNESVTEAFLLFPIVFEPLPVTAPAIIVSHPVDELPGRKRMGTEVMVCEDL
jgi:hypothetical protein